MPSASPTSRAAFSGGSRKGARRRRLTRWLLCVTAAMAVTVQAQSLDGDGAKRLFDSYCSACHQYDGQSMGEAPPLDDSPWVAGPSERLIRILLHGVKGRMVVQGRAYDREMPGFGKILSDRELAALATYVRERFGAAEAKPVTVTDIERVREAHPGRTEYWPASELLELR